MFNLLPQEEKAALRTEYRYREYTVIVGALLALFVAGIASLVPSYILSITKRQTIDIDRQSLEQELNRNSGTAADTVARAQALSTSLAAIPEEQISTWLKTIIESRPAGVVLLRFSFVEGAEGGLALELQGVSRSRTALQQFERTLQSVPKLTGVKVPIESYTRETNIPFTITATILK